MCPEWLYSNRMCDISRLEMPGIRSGENRHQAHTSDSTHHCRIHQSSQTNLHEELHNV